MTTADVHISLFANVTSQDNAQAEIRTVLADIRGGKWRAPVEGVRGAFTNVGEHAADQLKKLLPAVTFSGMFSGSHRAEALKTHSGMLCLDFDGINGRLANVKRKLASDPHCFALFISPSGTGLKLVTKIPPDAAGHGRAFDAAAAYFKKIYNLDADKSGRDICRLCFVSYDPELVHNPDASIFELPPARAIKPRPMPAQNFDDAPDRAKAEDALRHISADCSFDDWLRIGMALHSWFPTEGRAIWDSWSRTAPQRYQAAAIGQHWKTFKGGVVTMATLFKQAKDSGWKPAWKTTTHVSKAPPIEDVGKAKSGQAAENIIQLPGAGVSITKAAENIFRRIAPSHELFIRGGAVMELRADDDGGLRLDILRAQAFRSRIEKLGVLFAWRSGKESQPVLKPTTCPTDTAEALLASQPAADLLPKVRGLAACPVLMEVEGQPQVLTKGYHIFNGGLLVTSGGKHLLDLTLDEAVEMLRLLVEEFDFAAPSDRSRALASFITPALRIGGWLRGHIPIDIAEANLSQSGKGYRQKLIFAVYGEEPYRIALRDGGVGGLDESIQQALITGRPFIQVDNVRGRIESQFIEMMATAGGCVGARVPHKGEVPVDSRHFILMMTSNGVETTRDLANRASIIRIRKRPGYIFRTFPEGDLLDHVQANQARFLAAVFAIIRAWHSAGKPRTFDTRHDFREWAQILGWIVQNLLGEAPLMDGHEQAQERVSNSALTWLRRVALAVEADQRLDEEITAGGIGELCEAHAVEIPGLRDASDEVARNKRIGVLMKKAFDAVDQIDVDRCRVKRTEAEKYDQAEQRFRTLKTYTFTIQEAELPHYRTTAQGIQLPKKPDGFIESIDPYAVGAVTREVDPVEAEELAAIQEEGSLNP